MRKILAVVVMAASAAVLTAQPAKVDTAKDGKFTAKFPTPPSVQKKTAGGLTLNVYVSENDKVKGGFMVVYGDIPPEVVKAPQPAKVLESAENGLKENFKAKVTKSAATEFGPKKYPARELTAEKEDNMWNLRGVLVLVGNRLYQVYVYGPKDFIASQEADDFLKSFEIVG